MLQALKGTSKISFVGGNQEWVLPGNGASAVLLKMDAEQGRVGTPSALIKQGSKPEDSVLPALPAPVIYQNHLPKGDVKAWQSKIDWEFLKKELVKIKGDSCDALENADASFEPKVVGVLTYNRLLISGFCSSGAYHTNYGYWIIHQEQPYQPKLITMIGEDEMEDNTIVFRMKEDVLGDCWSHQSWVWNGNDFIQDSNIPSAMCRKIAMGGAWTLPTYVSIVK